MLPTLLSLIIIIIITGLLFEYKKAQLIALQSIS